VIDTATNAVTDTIAVGGLPIGLAVDPLADEVYVTTYVGNMPVIDTTTGEVTDTIDVQGRGVAVDPAAHEAYVSTGETLVVIDTATHLAIATVENVDGGGPVVVDPGTRTIFVADYFGDAVWVIDAVTRQVVDSIPVGSAGPTDIALNPALGEVYVTNGDDVTVSVIDVATNTVIDTIGIPGPAEYAGSVAVDPVAQAIYVGLTALTGDPESWSWSAVARIDAATREVTDLITVGTDVDRIAVDPTTGTVYVTGGTVSVLQAD
jgi:YVTN family beta-propeller protein